MFLCFLQLTESPSKQSLPGKRKSWLKLEIFPRFLCRIRLIFLMTLVLRSRNFILLLKEQYMSPVDTCLKKNPREFLVKTYDIGCQTCALEAQGTGIGAWGYNSSWGRCACQARSCLLRAAFWSVSQKNRIASRVWLCHGMILSFFIIRNSKTVTFLS